MKSLIALAFVLPLLQSASQPMDALVLLRSVTQRYEQATSYHLEVVDERTFSNELSRSWQKTLLTAIVAPGGRYRYEGRSGHGSAIVVSDGTAKWVYHLNERLYTKHSVSSSTVPDKRHIVSEEEMPVEEAKRAVTKIRTLANRLKSATLLPDETIPINGRSVDCYVVRFSDADFTTRKNDLKITETVWMDKAKRVIVKTTSRSDTYAVLAGSGAHIPDLLEETTLYPVVELDEQEPATSFVFAPPSDAKLVAAFPNSVAHYEDVRAEFIGKQAPDMRLKGLDGKVTTLAAFRGKPVFIDFWATWCVPCVELMPDLRKLYAETAPKGLVWISIDNDDDARSATDLLAKENIAWPNYHDDDGSLGNSLGREGVPLGVLVDAEGKITFYKTGYAISDLRAAIAKLK